jgi:hypothetical protein
MARCFDVLVLASALAVQLCTLLFAPTVLIVRLPANFCMTPGNAVVYAPPLFADFQRPAGHATSQEGK